MSVGPSVSAPLQIFDGRFTSTPVGIRKSRRVFYKLLLLLFLLLFDVLLLRLLLLEVLLLLLLALEGAFVNLLLVCRVAVVLLQLLVEGGALPVQLLLLQ